MRIGVDLMGADTLPSLLFEGVVSSATQLNPSDTIIVFATKDVHSQIVSKKYPQNKHASIEYVIVNDIIAMEDAPVSSIKTKKNSSLVIGLRTLASKEMDAFISCGNTGAVTAGAVLLLQKFPGIHRPGLIATLPSKKGPVAVIDVGGTTTSRARHLVEFAQLGAVYHSVMFGTKKPSVGLLNIGVESKKGREEVQEAYNRLESLVKTAHGRWHFYGNIEGRDLFSGDVDVIVTDGFTGNVLLKTAEGTAAFVFDVIKKGLGDVKEKSLDDVCRQFCDEQQSGALLCGVENIVIKIHGNASAKSIHQAILKASSYIEADVISRLRARGQA